MLMPASVLILTKNEEHDLPDCLCSVAWSDDIHVYDSFSNDRTVEIAQMFGAKIAQRHFDNYASQRNAALKLPFKYKWVLSLDADERVSPALADEIKDFLASPPENVAACRIRRRDYFWETWLKHTQMSPFYIRLVKPPCVQYEREVNEFVKVDGLIFDLKQPFDHYPFSKGVSHWLNRHNQYSSMEAQQILKANCESTFPIIKAAITSPDFNQRRFYQKQLYYRLPLRPLIKFFYLIFIRRAFLDGKAGITYSLLMMIYEYLIVLKVQEESHLSQKVNQSICIETSTVVSDRSLS
jgi:glycosyltransferase involved in cell wall biosynthesis